MMQTMGERIKARRTALGLTQLQVAIRAKVSPSTIGSLEGNDPKYNPTLSMVERVAAALDTQPCALLCGGFYVVHRPLRPPAVRFFWDWVRKLFGELYR